MNVQARCQLSVWGEAVVLEIVCHPGNTWCSTTINKKTTNDSFSQLLDNVLGGIWIIGGRKFHYTRKWKLFGIDNKNKNVKAVYGLTLWYFVRLSNFSPHALLKVLTIGAWWKAKIDSGHVS